MKRRQLAGVALPLALGWAALAQNGNEDPWMGTWVVNMPRSSHVDLEDVPDSSTLRFERAGGVTRMIESGRNYRGQPVHSVQVLDPAGPPVSPPGAPGA